MFAIAKDVCELQEVKTHIGTKFENLLPKMPGAVCAQMVRCGKPSCKCARGELHGPYFYRFVWEDGKQRKCYVRKEELQQIRAACAAYKNEARLRRSQQKTDKLSIRALLDNLEEFEKLIAQLKGG